MHIVFDITQARKGKRLAQRAALRGGGAAPEAVVTTVKLEAHIRRFCTQRKRRECNFIDLSQATVPLL